MSQYTTMHGNVHCDPAAGHIFQELPSWEWVTEQGAETPLLVTEHDDGSVTVHFGGLPYRNLSRFVDVDLYEAQKYGKVVGELTIDCVDGCNVRTVVDYRGDRTLVGNNECLALPTRVRPASIKLISAGSHEIVFLAGDMLEAGELLEGAGTIEWCGCCGYDETKDTTVCANA